MDVTGSRVQGMQKVQRGGGHQKDQFESQPHQVVKGSRKMMLCGLPTEFPSPSHPTHNSGSPGPMGVGARGWVLENIGLVQPAMVEPQTLLVHGRTTLDFLDSLDVHVSRTNKIHLACHISHVSADQGSRR